jgi:hypothetical protein
MKQGGRRRTFDTPAQHTLMPAGTVHLNYAYRADLTFPAPKQDTYDQAGATVAQYGTPFPTCLHISVPDLDPEICASRIRIRILPLSSK